MEELVPGFRDTIDRRLGELLRKESEIVSPSKDGVAGPLNHRDRDIRVRGGLANGSIKAEKGIGPFQRKGTML